MAKTVTIFGGTGFIGRYVVALLAKQGWNIRVVLRRQDRGLFLKPMGSLGQIQLLVADIHKPEMLAAALQGSVAAINLLGILRQRGRQTFKRIHIQAAENIARSAAASGVRHLIHISAIGANDQSTSQYARTKAMGEKQVRHHFPQAVILRPSVVFGPEDSFFNRFARLARYSLVLPIICPKTKFQPIFVQDVAQAIIKCLEQPQTEGHIYELGGPKIYTFQDIWNYTLKVVGRSRFLIRLPMILAKPMTWLTGWMPGSPLTLDQLRLLEMDNLVSKQSLSLSDLGIVATNLEKIVPAYLSLYKAKIQRNITNYGYTQFD